VSVAPSGLARYLKMIQGLRARCASHLPLATFWSPLRGWRYLLVGCAGWRYLLVAPSGLARCLKVIYHCCWLCRRIFGGIALTVLGRAAVLNDFEVRGGNCQLES
jgi:hypothetical protein